MYPNVEGKNMRASLPLLVRTYEGYACIKMSTFQKHFVLNGIFTVYLFIDYYTRYVQSIR